MKKLVLSVATTLDGFIEGPNGEMDWLPFSEDGMQALEKFITEIDTVFYGRVSYESWGNRIPTEESSTFEKNFYGRLNTMNRYVFSTTRTQFPGEPQVINSNIAETVNKLKQGPGKNIWLYGGAKLLTTMMNLNLVDELRIAVFPVIIGAGKPLFTGIDHYIKLRLIDTKTGKSGVTELRYERSEG